MTRNSSFFISFSLLFPLLSLSQLLHHHRDRATSSSLYSCICFPKRGFDFLLKIALASDFFLFIPVYHAAFFSCAAPNTMRKRRKERNSRENQNKNPREEEGRREWRWGRRRDGWTKKQPKNVSRNSNDSRVLFVECKQVFRRAWELSVRCFSSPQNSPSSDCFSTKYFH